jgi:hypothetical protein
MQFFKKLPTLKILYANNMEIHFEAEKQENFYDQDFEFNRNIKYQYV